MYSWDTSNSKIELYPLLEGAEINGVVLKWVYEEQEKLIKLHNPSLDRFEKNGQETRAFRVYR